MQHLAIADELARNRGVFEKLLKGSPPEFYTWRPAPDKWSLLEITCHLFDEEREDFRTRLLHALTRPNAPLPPIDPEGWVTQRRYSDKDFEKTLARFLAERKRSVAWLRSLESPDWGNAFQHRYHGAMTAGQLLANWLAHDCLHLRQINRYRYEFWREKTGEDLSYAGDW